MANQIKYGSVIVYTNIFLNLILNFALTPLLLSYLGDEEYGVYKAIQSFTGQLAVMSFGISTVVTRYIVLYNSRNQTKEKENFLFSIFNIAGILAALVGFLGFVIYLNIESIFATSFSQSEILIAKQLCLFLVANVALSILCDAFIGIIRAYEKFIVANLISTGRLVFRLLLIVVLLNLGFKSLAIVSTDLLITIVILLFTFLYSRFELGEKSHFWRIDKVLLREIATFAGAVFLQAIVNQVNQNMDNTILGIMTNTSCVTKYSIALTLYTCFISLVTALSNMYTPRATQLVAKGATKEELTSFVIGPGRIQLVLAMLCILGFIIAGQDFLSAWLGPGYEEVYGIVLVLIIPAVIPLVESLTNTILDALLKRLARSLALLGMCIVNVLSSIVFIKLFGYRGAALGTALSVIVGHGILINIYLHKVIGLNVLRIYKDCFSGLVPAFALSLLLSIWLFFIPLSGIVGFIVKGAYITLVFLVLVYKIGMTEVEKSRVNKQLLVIKNKLGV